MPLKTYVFIVSKPAGNRTTRSVALNEEKVTWRVQNTERQHNNDYRYNSQYLTLMNE